MMAGNNVSSVMDATDVTTCALTNTVSTSNNGSTATVSISPSSYMITTMNNTLISMSSTSSGKDNLHRPLHGLTN